MPFHLFIAQSVSLATGGLEVWKVGKDIFLAFVTLFTICLVFWEKRASRGFLILFGLTVAYGLLHGLEWVTHPHIYDRSAVVGIIYNVRVPCFALLGYGAALLTPRKFAFSSLAKIVVGVSSMVVCLGLLQYFLPKDILTHLGYGADRGALPAFFIDDNPAFPRIMATLRDPNSLGAYLLLPMAVLIRYVLQPVARRRFAAAALLAAHAVALYLTFSRGAWLAAVCVTVMLVWWRYRGMTVWAARHGWAIVVALVFVFCISMYIIRNTTFYQGVIIHATSQDSPADRNSNGYHVEFARQGIMGIAAQPYGHGPGTAGLASIQDPAGSFLTENYFIQIGYEVGLIGLAVCIAIHAWLYGQIILSAHRLRGVLLVTFWGYVIMNMLFHMWSNEAVAAQWWLLAGAVAALPATAATRVTSQ